VPRLTTNLMKRHVPPTHDDLHPFVYKTMVGLTVWLVVSIWFLFYRGAYVGLTFAVVTLFFVVIMAIPVLLWLTWRRNAAKDNSARRIDAFRSWAAQEFATLTGNLSGTEAATQILLPLAAVSLGMTIFGLVFYFAVPYAG
jgi:hypothetical protein